MSKEMTYDDAIEVAKTALKIMAHRARKSAANEKESANQFPHTPQVILDAVEGVRVAFLQTAESAEAALLVFEKIEQAKDELKNEGKQQ